MEMDGKLYVVLKTPSSRFEKVESRTCASIFVENDIIKSSFKMYNCKVFRNKCQRKPNTVYSYPYIESEGTECLEIESRMMVSRS